MENKIKDKAGDVKDKATSNGDGGMFSSLMSKEVVIPALATAGTVAAFAVKKGMSQARKRPRTRPRTSASARPRAPRRGSQVPHRGPRRARLEGAARRRRRSGGGGKAKKTASTFRFSAGPTSRTPIDTVWERLADRLRGVPELHAPRPERGEGRQRPQVGREDRSSKRQWEGEITERRKNERIAWKTTSGMAHAGVVTFTYRLEEQPHPRDGRHGLRAAGDDREDGLRHALREASRRGRPRAVQGVCRAR